MTLTNTATKIKPGMTLIEITVVILVLLTLISVLFIGANVYKNGADRAACILNIRNIHQSTRAEQNLTGATAGDTLAAAATIGSTLVGTDLYFAVAPTCPRDATAYTGMTGTAYPADGTVVVACATFGDAAGKHFPDPADVAGW